jgi:hypothetical protein
VIDNNYEIHLKKPVHCNKLFPHAIKMANEKFIPMCAGITGSISRVIADKGHQADHSGLQDDMLIVDFTKIDGKVDSNINIDDDY